MFTHPVSVLIFPQFPIYIYVYIPTYSFIFPYIMYIYNIIYIYIYIIVPYIVIVIYPLISHVPMSSIPIKLATRNGATLKKPPRLRGSVGPTARSNYGGLTSRQHSYGIIYGNDMFFNENKF